MLPDRYKSRCPSLAPLLQPQRRKYILGGLGILITIIVIIIVVVVAISSEKDSFVLDRMPLFAGRNNLPQNIYELTGGNLSKIDLNKNLSNNTEIKTKCPYCNTDFVRLREGKVSSQFWVAQSTCEEHSKIVQPMDQIDLINRMIDQYPDLHLIKTPKDLEETFSNKKLGSLIMLDGGQSLSKSLSMLRTYHKLGVKALTLSSGCNASSEVDNDIEESEDLSEFGQFVVEEMNKLGMIIDVQGLGYNTVNTILNISKAPVLFSHAAANGVYNFSENLEDSTLKLLKEKDGLVLITFDNLYLGFHEENITKITVIEHINYIADKIGFDNIGIGGNYDSKYRKPLGLEDVSHFPDLFKELKNSNNTKWCPENLDKLALLNFQRFFENVEKAKNKKEVLEHE